MNGSCRIGLTLVAFLAGNAQPAAAQPDIDLMRSLMPAGGVCSTAINSKSISCNLPSLGPKGLGFHLQYNDSGWGTAHVHFSFSHDIDELRPYVPQVRAYFYALGVPRQDVVRCIDDAFEATETTSFAITRFVLGTGIGKGYVPLGKMSLTCEVIVWPTYSTDKTTGHSLLPGATFSVSWMADGRPPASPDPPKRYRRARDGD